MASLQPVGEPAPSDGILPTSALAGYGSRPLGVYVHVPFCATRCGYCDFNTYTAGELGTSASPTSYLEAALAEIRFAAKVLGGAGPPVSTIFFGGGTPTLLPPDDLGLLIAAIRVEFGLPADAEITTEANPDSIDEAGLHRLRAAGFTRVSFGMQSVRPHVLAVLDRTHTAGRPQLAVAEARRAGFDHVNLDLIYGTPGESDADWLASLEAAVGAGVDHVSAYALIVEDGTRLSRQVVAGQLAAPDDEVLADRYLLADEVLGAAGLQWYEVSNWAAGPAARCRHNELYWSGADWWGIGPGAHSHVGGTRWWNVKHPAAYADRLAAGASPAQAREVLTPATQQVERVLLGIRLADGLGVAELSEPGQRRARQLVEDGLLAPGPIADGRLVLTLRGRLLADAVVRELLD